MCDYHLSTPTQKIGGGERVRTDDLLLAKQVLSQLSYAPEEMVGLGRLELPTSRLSGVRSNQLSYRPKIVLLTASILPSLVKYHLEERDAKTANHR